MSFHNKFYHDNGVTTLHKDNLIGVSNFGKVVYKVTQQS